MGNIYRTTIKGMQGFLCILKDYCLNSSLSGLAYIANNNFHITERIFWLACITVSSIGSYKLINEYLESFEGNAISIVTEGVRPIEKVHLPSLAVCEIGYTKETYPTLKAFVNGLHEIPNSEVEDFLLRIVFQNLYSFHALHPYCVKYYSCTTNCSKCPESGYAEIENLVRTNCTNLFRKCSWKGIEFDCCHYFLPLETTMGKCFLLNSIQITEKNGDNWLNMDINWDDRNAFLDLNITRPFSVNILNEEDIPQIMLKSLVFSTTTPNSEQVLKLNLQNVINDLGVRNVAVKHRKCLFPDEVPDNFTQKFYSFSTCVTHCLKNHQLKVCNCTNYNMIFDEDDKSPPCDLQGFLCLDQKDLLYPQTTIMQPWRTNGLVCQCYPSCNEHEITVVEQTFKVTKNEDRHIQIGLFSFPIQRYRRQAVRDNLDVVVTIGGIVGLFMGASILSAIELLYFFTIRIAGNS